MDKVYLTAIAAADLQKHLVMQHSKKLDDVGLKFLTRPYFFTSILKSALGYINLLITTALKHRNSYFRTGSINYDHSHSFANKLINAVSLRLHRNFGFMSKTNKLVSKLIESGEHNS